MPTKNQHFVPQFYLRNFSPSGKVIGTFVLPTQYVFENAEIRNQCYRVNTYKSQQNEAALCAIEGKHAALVHSLIIAGYKGGLTKPHRIRLISFVSLMLLRNANETDLLKRKFEVIAEETGNASDAARSYAEVATAADYVVMSLSFHEGIALTMLDLGIAFLNNQTEIPFHTSDAPVVTYNLLYQDAKKMGFRGTASTGVIFYLPLSPSLAVFLYDKNCYRIKGTDGGSTNITEADVDVLNSLTMVNAKQCVYFNQSNAAALASIQRQSLRLKIKRKIHHVETVNRDDPNDHVSHTFDRFPNLKIRLSFLKVPKHIMHTRELLKATRVTSRQPQDYQHNDNSSDINRESYITVRQRIESL